MLHEIKFHDAQGRVALPEFLRLAGLLAADAADADDLAEEFLREEVTLFCEPDELADTTAYGWYLASFDAYGLGDRARDARTGEAYDDLAGRAHVAYRELLEDAAHYLASAAAEARVTVTELAPVLPLRPRA